MTHTVSPSSATRQDVAVVTTVLQGCLSDLIDLSLVAKQAHWNVVGANSRSAHLQLDKLVRIARQHTDEIAERSAAIGASPDGLADSVTRTSTLPPYPRGRQSVEATVDAIVGTLDGLVGRTRDRIDQAGGDPVTLDLLVQVARDLEKARWMWQILQA